MKYWNRYGVSPSENVATFDEMNFTVMLFNYIILTS